MPLEAERQSRLETDKPNIQATNFANELMWQVKLNVTLRGRAL